MVVLNRSLYLATKTLSLIDTTIEADGGNSYRYWLGRVLPHIGDAYRTNEDGERTHLGASVIGDECGRKLWYGFRWAKRGKFPGRVLRLFNRGHLEEGRFIAMLLMIGCTIYQQDANGKQYRFDHSQGHGGGSPDGIVVGIPDIDAGTPCLLEFKTHGDKSFSDLKAQGVRSSKFEHYVQCQIGLRKFGLTVSLYLAVNKNTDELYGEILPLNAEIADSYLERMDKIIYSEEPPSRISESPGFWKCKWCQFHGICHLNEDPAPNCRTCVNGDPYRENGMWQCKKHGFFPTKAEQMKGCGDYEVRKT